MATIYNISFILTYLLKSYLNIVLTNSCKSIKWNDTI